MEKRRRKGKKEDYNAKKGRERESVGDMWRPREIEGERLEKGIIRRRKGGGAERKRKSGREALRATEIMWKSNAISSK